ncbi:MAG: radical SAM protein [Spirochaetia bacterium]|nr:radical SAM protein [Spirochaetia bacterium]
MSKQFLVPVCTLLAEKSPQALPLGAACIVTGIQTYFEKNHLKIGTVTSKLSVFEYSATPIHRQTEAIAQRLLQDAPFALCFSLYLWNHPVLEQAARIVKRINPAVYLIAGGPEVTAGSLHDHPFDFLVAGEGEIAVPQLLHKLITLQNSEQQTAKENLPEQYVRSNRIPYEQLTSPYLSGVLNPQDYQGGALWELARGCPFKCAYCYESKGEKTVSYFPVERIKKELEFFAEKKVVQVFVLDPTYNAQKNRALEILNLIKTITPHTFYHFECRAEFLNPEMAKAFSHIPCSLQIGLQSAHENVLKLVDRSFNKKDFIKKINMLNQQGVVFGFDLIYGLPQDTLQGFRESIDFAISLYPNSLELFRLAVLPGTTLFDKKDLLGLTAQAEPPYLVQSTESLRSGCSLLSKRSKKIPLKDKSLSSKKGPQWKNLK